MLSLLPFEDQPPAAMVTTVAARKPASNIGEEGQVVFTYSICEDTIKDAIGRKSEDDSLV